MRIIFFFTGMYTLYYLYNVTLQSKLHTYQMMTQSSPTAFEFKYIRVKKIETIRLSIKKSSEYILLQVIQSLHACGSFYFFCGNHKEILYMRTQISLLNGTMKNHLHE